MKRDERISMLHETRLGIKDSVAACGHMGMGLPVGGLCNPAPPHEAGQLFIGPAGCLFAWKAKKRKILNFYRISSMDISICVVLGWAVVLSSSPK